MPGFATSASKKGEQQPSAPHHVEDLQDRWSPVTLCEVRGHRGPGPQTGALPVVRRNLGQQPLTANQHLEGQLVGAGVVVAVGCNGSVADHFLKRSAYVPSGRRHEVESAPR